VASSHSAGGHGSVEAGHCQRARLWSRWAEIGKNLDAYAALRPAETAVAVLEPQDSAGPKSSHDALRATHEDVRPVQRPRLATWIP
jgi:hypothetical protein